VIFPDISIWTSPPSYVSECPVGHRYWALLDPPPSPHFTGGGGGACTYVHGRKSGNSGIRCTNRYTTPSGSHGPSLQHLFYFLPICNVCILISIRVFIIRLIVFHRKNPDSLEEGMLPLLPFFPRPQVNLEEGGYLNPPGPKWAPPLASLPGCSQILGIAQNLLGLPNLL